MEARLGQEWAQQRHMGHQTAQMAKGHKQTSNSEGSLTLLPLLRRQRAGLRAPLLPLHHQSLDVFFEEPLRSRGELVRSDGGGGGEKAGGKRCENGRARCTANGNGKHTSPVGKRVRTVGDKLKESERARLRLLRDGGSSSQTSGPRALGQQQGGWRGQLGGATQ